MHLREAARQKKRRLAIDGVPFKKLSVRDVPASQRLVLALMDGVIARAKPDPEEIVPLSKVAPPEPQAGEAAAQEEAREGSFDVKEFKQTHEWQNHSALPKTLRMGNRQQQDAMRDVVGMPYLDVDAFTGVKGATLEQNARSLITAAAFCMDALNRLPLQDIDPLTRAAWVRSVTELQMRGQRVKRKLKHKQEAKTS